MTRKSNGSTAATSNPPRTSDRRSSSSSSLTPQRRTARKRPSSALVVRCDVEPREVLDEAERRDRETQQLREARQQPRRPALALGPALARRRGRILAAEQAAQNEAPRALEQKQRRAAVTRRPGREAERTEPRCFERERGASRAHFHHNHHVAAAARAVGPRQAPALGAEPRAVAQENGRPLRARVAAPTTAAARPSRRRAVDLDRDLPPARQRPRRRIQRTHRDAPRRPPPEPRDPPHAVQVVA
mmetsp:Transcript_5382/g.22213  ORF Transcript_5382/g.22213 Transcript_5382/m.22213 type:complete len:245 (-) Transcript_5382:759-1493(-)